MGPHDRPLADKVAGSPVVGTVARVVVEAVIVGWVLGAGTDADCRGET